jgi:dolichol-phosphate mannosyltransferase
MQSVSVVICTKNERDNIRQLLLQLLQYKYEIIVVDDSDDITPMIAKSLGVFVIHGQRKGLGQAIIDGINAANSDVVLVMDADGSHDVKEIPNLLDPIFKQGADLVIGSRYISGGDYSNWALKRKIQSLIGVKLMQLVTGVTDSNSGFFAFRKSIIKDIQLKPHSWKIMLEVLFKGKWIFKKEVPIHFTDRISGKSKNNLKEKIRQSTHILKLLVYKFPKRYINFALIGGIGALSYFVIFWAITEYTHIWYGYSYFIATTFAIVQNYILNHLITFRHEKHNNTNHFKGIVKYFGGSWFGELVEYGIMILLTEMFGIWYILSDFIGSGFSSVIKYVIFKKSIWGNKAEHVANNADYEWKSYYKGLLWQKRWKQKIAGIVKDMAGDCGMTLDVGSGSSPLGLNTNHSHYIGVDSSYNKIYYMRDKLLDNCEFHVSTCDKLAFQSDSFDTVLFIEVIEHLPIGIATRTIKEINRVLKQGGQAIIATPNFGSWTGKMQDKLYGIFQKGAYQEEHISKFDLESLKKLCQNNGLIYARSVIPMGSDMICKFIKPFKQ